MFVYRLARERFARQLDGQGAALFGGRWNSVGRSVIYTAQHRSLAVLEYRVNNPLPVKDLIMLVLEVPDNSMEVVEAEGLPENWRSYSFESPCTRIGDEWLAGQGSLVLKIPSAIVPQESNFLINPHHPDMEKVKIAEALPFLIDHRVYEQGQ